MERKETIFIIGEDFFNRPNNRSNQDDFKATVNNNELIRDFNAAIIYSTELREKFNKLNNEIEILKKTYNTSQPTKNIYIAYAESIMLSSELSEKHSLCKQILSDIQFIEEHLDAVSSSIVNSYKPITGDISLNKDWITYYFGREDFKSILDSVKFDSTEDAKFVQHSLSMLDIISSEKDACIDALSRIDKQKSDLHDIIATEINNESLSDPFILKAQMDDYKLSEEFFKLLKKSKELSDQYEKVKSIVFNRLNALFIARSL